MVDATRRKSPWSLTVFGLLVIGGLVTMPLVAGDPVAGKLPDVARFIGRFHPVLLHLPIGVFALILVQELGMMMGRGGRAGETPSLFPLGFGAASAVVASTAGFLLCQGDAADYVGNELVERHLWGGTAFAAVALFTLIVRAWTVSLGAGPVWYRVLLFTGVGVMGFASHEGASITHGSGYLFRYAPAPIRKLFGLNAAKIPVPTADPGVYAEIVAPILERRCVSCHGEEKSKGKFRMDTYELLVKGGKEGPGIEPGSAADSNIVVRMGLPEGDDEHMPPEGKPQITDDEIRVVKWWLDHGADPEKRLAEFEVPAEVRATLAALPKDKATLSAGGSAAGTALDE